MRKSPGVAGLRPHRTPMILSLYVSIMLLLVVKIRMCGRTSGLSAGPDTVAGIQVTQRVLVVDDVAEIRTLIQRVLSADGYQVDVAATLAEARGMQPAGYAVVVVDSHLGTESGIDLIDELRSADPGAACRCLVITGDQADASSGLAFLAKPFRAADLLDAVRALPHPAPSTVEPGLGEPRSPGSGSPGTGPSGTGPSGTGSPGTGSPGTGPSGTGPSGSGSPGTGPSGTGRPGPEPGTSSAPAPPSGSPPPPSPPPTPGPDQAPAGRDPPAARPGAS